jgi:hypothetical protein
MIWPARHIVLTLRERLRRLQFGDRVRMNALLQLVWILKAVEKTTLLALLLAELLVDRMK